MDYRDRHTQEIIRMYREAAIFEFRGMYFAVLQPDVFRRHVTGEVGQVYVISCLYGIPQFAELTVYTPGGRCIVVCQRFPLRRIQTLVRQWLKRRRAVRQTLAWSLHPRLGEGASKLLTCDLMYELIWRL